MKKVEMVEKTTYFCDICGVDITYEYKNFCKVCGREHCDTCHIRVKGSKGILMGICLICNEIYAKFKKQMDESYYVYDELYRQDVLEINDRWKEESLLIDNKED